MIVADTSALVSLATADALQLVLDEFNVHTTETVVGELEATAEYDDVYGETAQVVLADRDRMSVHDTGSRGIESSRIDGGEATCVVLAGQIDAAFLLTDDLRALPELQPLADARVALSPIVLRALVNRGVLDRGEARDCLELIAQQRGWLGAPIYRRAVKLFEREEG